MQDIIDYRDMVQDEAYILFLDFFKAFDTLEHTFLFQALELFGFGKVFCDFVKTCYANTNAAVSLTGGATTRFPIQVGVKQGCPISPYIFLLAVEMLAIYLKNCPDLQTLTIFGSDITISQLADDTTIFLKNKHQIPVAIKRIDTFSRASGLRLNMSKCELMSIKESNDITIDNIPVKNEIKYLGIYVTKEKQRSIKLNISDAFHKGKTSLDRWHQRDLSIFGRVYLTKK